MQRKLTTFISRGEIKDGKLFLANPRYFRTIVSNYADEPKVRVIVEKERGAKTKKQLGYLFGVVYPEIATHTGHSIEELDAIFKSRYLKKKLMWRGGELTTINSKANLTSEEMGEFISAILLEASELGISVAPADKEWMTHEQFPDSRI